MRVTFNIMLHDLARKSKEYSVLLRITIARKHKKITLPVTVSNKNHFNLNANRGVWIRKGDPDHKIKNQKILDQLKRHEKSFENLLDKGRTPTHQMIINNISAGSSKSLLDYSDKQLKLYEDKGQINYARHFKSIFKQLREYVEENNWHDLSFEEVDVTFLKSYEANLSKNGNNKNTIAKKFRVIRATLYNAARESIILPESIPFQIFKIKTERTSNKALSLDELEKLVQCTPIEESDEWDAKNYFLFSLYCAGIRIGDLILLRWSNISNNRLEYTMRKNGKIQNIALNEKAQLILEYYKNPTTPKKNLIFPILNQSIDMKKKEELERQISAKTASINRALKSLAKLAEIDTPITTHMARHSFSDIARQNGASVYDISKLLQHSDLKTTEGYLASLDRTSADSVLKGL